MSHCSGSLRFRGEYEDLIRFMQNELGYKYYNTGEFIPDKKIVIARIRPNSSVIKIEMTSDECLSIKCLKNNTVCRTISSYININNYIVLNFTAIPRLSSLASLELCKKYNVELKFDGSNSQEKYAQSLYVTPDHIEYNSIIDYQDYIFDCPFSLGY